MLHGIRNYAGIIRIFPRIIILLEPNVDTYKLEGDGSLVLQCYEVIEEVKAAVQSGYTPNVDAVV